MILLILINYLHLKFLTEDVLKLLEPIVAAKFKYGEEIDVENLTEMLEADVEEKS